MLTDVKAYRNAATGTVFGQRTRIKGVVITGTATAGSAVFRDGGASGNVVLELDIPVNFQTDVIVPGEGIVCQTDVHVTMTNVASVVTFCG